MDRTHAKNKLTNDISSFLCMMAKILPDDVYNRLVEMRAKETDPAALSIYDCMFKNMDLAVSMDRPVCQDTGLIQFFVKAGSECKYLGVVESALIDAVKIATKEAPLRPNAVDTFTEKNTGNNIAKGSPLISWEIVPDSDELEITIYMAGGGCSLPGKAIVLMPSQGFEGIVETVLSSACDRGINACPPLIVGVGIGTCADSAGELSKKALVRPVGSVNPDPEAAKLEKILFDSLNGIGIGPNALKGAESVLGVNVEYGAHHPATLAVGVSFGCWATRHGVIRFDASMNSTIESHKREVAK